MPTQPDSTTPLTPIGFCAQCEKLSSQESHELASIVSRLGAKNVLVLLKVLIRLSAVMEVVK